MYSTAPRRLVSSLLLAASASSSRRGVGRAAARSRHCRESPESHARLRAPRRAGRGPHRRLRPPARGRIARPERRAIVWAEVGEQRRGASSRHGERPGLGRRGRVDHEMRDRCLWGPRRPSRRGAGRGGSRAPPSRLVGDLASAFIGTSAAVSAWRARYATGSLSRAVEQLDREMGPGDEVEGLDDDALALRATVHARADTGGAGARGRETREPLRCAAARRARPRRPSGRRSATIRLRPLPGEPGLRRSASPHASLHARLDGVKARVVHTRRRPRRRGCLVEPA